MTTQITPQVNANTPAAPSTEAARPGPVFLPATDIYDTGNGLVLFAEIPGADPASIAVSFERSVLRIGAHSKKTAPTGHSLIHAEYRNGDYERAFTLPADVDAERIEATVKDGLLKVVLPKLAPPPARQIAVTVA